MNADDQVRIVFRNGNAKQLVARESKIARVSITSHIAGDRVGDDRFRILGSKREPAQPILCMSLEPHTDPRAGATKSLPRPALLEAGFAEVFADPGGEGEGEGGGEVALVAVDEGVADHGAADVAGADLGGEVDQLGAG